MGKADEGRREREALAPGLWRGLAPGSQPEPADMPPAKGLVLFVLLVCWLGLLVAGPTLREPNFVIGRDQPFLYYEDATGSLSFEDVVAMPDSAMTLSHQPLTQGYRPSVFWLRFDAPRSWFQGDDLWLEMSPGYLDHVSVFWRPRGTGGSWEERQVGDRDGPGARPGDLNYRFPVLVIREPPQPEGYDFVVRVASTSTILVEPLFWNPVSFLGFATRDSVFWSFFLGMSTLSSALALLLAIGLKSRLLWSVVPFSTTYLLVACIQGYVGWSDAAWRVALQHYLTGALTLWGYPALVWMCIEALELWRYFPRAYRIALVAIGAGLLLPLSIPLGLYGQAVGLLAVLATITAPLLSFCALRLWWRARLGLVSLAFGIIPMFYIVSSLLTVFITTAVIPYDSVIYHFWQYSVMVIMMIIMLVVMTVGVYRIRRERRIHQERMQLEQELQRERQASAQQRQFMGMISHELRTPLAVIAATLENLRASAMPDPGTRRRYEKIERATRRLVQLTDNCLADARLSAGTLYLDRQEIDLVDEVRQVLALSEPSDEHRLQVFVEGRPLADPSLPRCPLAADGALVRIVLSNLIDNAVKYSVAGGAIRLEVTQRPGRWVVAVEDDGPGVPVEQAVAVFDRYRQGGAGEGWGLGLYVSRQIALAHGGDLVLAVNTLQCCRFELTLPSGAKA